MVGMNSGFRVNVGCLLKKIIGHRQKVYERLYKVKLFIGVFITCVHFWQNPDVIFKSHYTKHRGTQRYLLKLNKTLLEGQVG